LTTYAFTDYNVGMNSIQYTIRSIPPGLDKVLRQKSRETGRSLNDVVISTLERGSGVTFKTKFRDLDWFIGSKSLSHHFDKSMEWLDNLPKDM
jgi:hypothetical protein